MSHLDTPAAGPQTGGGWPDPASLDVDSERLDELLGRAIVDAGATTSAGLVVLGMRLGLYEALAGGPLTTAELAGRTGTAERYVREWVRAQAAGGYLTHDPDGDRYGMSPEHALAFNPRGPLNLGTMFRFAVRALTGLDRLEAAMRSGEGIGWHEQDDELVASVADFFRSGYAAHLVTEWIPALDGVHERLTAGARVADVGCGYGVTTILMAQAYPASEFEGYDYHDVSIERARKAAEAAGVSDRARFAVCAATEIPAGGYDLVCTFDALHDYGDPVGAARRMREALGEGGTWLLVEPAAGDRVQDNLHPMGRMFYAASTYMCVPNAVSQGGSAMGAQAGGQAMRGVLEEAGFTDVRLVASTPVNHVYQVRP
ncbi:class I SAM-dependent methyltransferase [Planomonospora parontospora]|uniref:class I SAM-dependent methyltransferase n=1 Tax=Planomonospora parontospora TaxID=58119 RepID=UPI00166FAD29|nr:class I SAM-dependent methyltransferase [Planomonospora parontospora]GGL13488.1 SAM-dependent methyltransferase [Planomonospora parontospora subsp. antibiotica]GII13913.1 SAM-dependent methyltransferase [Planomonospora parontospora subsp. antibiotica]